ncbi:D-glycero-beta-D-manno-heptose 1-phosphate adenylyltransferase [Peredibacter starrii]|uniref:D-glycero-beta-D-manno-heptose 1-phosphate adenylyltransferase n=1 Tax=Peredibacter starrii TaxID=28202 RepID=A0AAX4HQC2_9BACT|nr:D-glycero-beta-D-manno-heptose 1-phosphate adenylyltransferase [Peredibacter starrii]WPU65494.1 D-glycero-beta-D-manno-heptose 1-phosphate adenylyltransferase [Peredibacter starrii]
MFSPSLEHFLKQNEGKRIVFTNGCFDILHRGHVTYLAEARKLGDLLVVGVNSDASVKRLKGPERPINNENDRSYVLSQLKSVDFTEIFTEDTPLNLILKVQPKILVKGGDWKIDQIVGAKEVLANGGDVFSLNFVDGYSTTSIIQKIQA